MGVNNIYPKREITNRELELSDRLKLNRARLVCFVGLIFALVGAAGIVASASQTSWDDAHSFYTALVVTGPIAIWYGVRVFRQMMKKYLRPFSLIA